MKGRCLWGIIESFKICQTPHSWTGDRCPGGGAVPIADIIVATAILVSRLPLFLPHTTRSAGIGLPSSMTSRVMPKERVSPGRRSSHCTRRLLTYVPCFESRSRITNRPSLWLISQWCRLTHGSQRRTPQSEPLPTMIRRCPRVIVDVLSFPATFEAGSWFRRVRVW